MVKSPIENRNRYRVGFGSLSNPPPKAVRSPRNVTSVIASFFALITLHTREGCSCVSLKLFPSPRAFRVVSGGSRPKTSISYCTFFVFLCSFICLQAVYHLSGPVCKSIWRYFASYSASYLHFTLCD